MTLGTSPIDWISWTINIGHNQPTIFKWKYMQEIIFHIYSRTSNGHLTITAFSNDSIEEALRKQYLLIY